MLIKIYIYRDQELLFQKVLNTTSHTKKQNLYMYFPKGDIKIILSYIFIHCMFRYLKGNASGNATQ